MWSGPPARPWKEAVPFYGRGSCPEVKTDALESELHSMEARILLPPCHLVAFS